MTACAGLDATAAGVLMAAALFFSCLGGTVANLVAERERRTMRRWLTFWAWCWRSQRWP